MVSQNGKMEPASLLNGNPEKPKRAGGRVRSPEDIVNDYVLKDRRSLLHHKNVIGTSAGITNGWGGG